MVRGGSGLWPQGLGVCAVFRRTGGNDHRHGALRPLQFITRDLHQPLSRPQSTKRGRCTCEKSTPTIRPATTSMMHDGSTRSSNRRSAAIPTSICGCTGASRPGRRASRVHIEQAPIDCRDGRHREAALGASALRAAQSFASSPHRALRAALERSRQAHADRSPGKVECLRRARCAGRACRCRRRESRDHRLEQRHAERFGRPEANSSASNAVRYRAASGTWPAKCTRDPIPNDVPTIRAGRAVRRRRSARTAHRPAGHVPPQRPQRERRPFFRMQAADHADGMYRLRNRQLFARRRRGGSRGRIGTAMSAGLGSTSVVSASP